MNAKNSPRLTAFRDITEWMGRKTSYNWDISIYHLDTKEQRRLNRKLGVHKINMNRFNMNRKRKKLYK